LRPWRRCLICVICVSLRLLSILFHPAIIVSQAFIFGLHQGLVFNQESLSLIPFARAMGYRRIAGRQKSQVIEIGARQAQRAIGTNFAAGFVPVESNPSFPARSSTYISRYLGTRKRESSFSWKTYQPSWRTRWVRAKPFRQS
jgi:hypothetical protein